MRITACFSNLPLMCVTVAAFWLCSCNRLLVQTTVECRKDFKVSKIYLSPSNLSRPQGYKTFFVLNSTEYEISTAHKN